MEAIDASINKSYEEKVAYLFAVKNFNSDYDDTYKIAYTGITINCLYLK